jgi:hypothetical protein
MQVYLLNLFFRFSGYTFKLKQKIVGADNWFLLIPYSFLLIISELGFIFVSLPIYLLVSPAKLQEEGFIFPKKIKDKPEVHAYTIRRKITLTTVLGAGGIFLAKIVFIGLASFFLFGFQQLLADNQDWTFDTPGDYTYATSTIEVTGGVARLKDIGGTTIGSSTNPTFTGNANGWTYGDWLQPANTTVAGAYVATNGNPTGHTEITMTSTRRGRTIAGYYEQAFTTTVGTPDTATLDLDWKSITYTSPSTPTTYRVYAFIETTSGAPTATSTAVWSSPEITSTTAWAASTPIDITSKIPTAGTYYVKFAAYVVIPAGTNANFTYVSGFDNVSVNWSKVVHSYASNSPTTTPVTALSVPKAVSWNSFNETATKNGGEIYYQLSDDNGANWKYYTAGAWATTTSITAYNTATQINTGLPSFATSTNQIKWRAYLVGNGTQQVTLDNVAITYTQNQRPVIQNLAPAQNTNYGYVHAAYNLIDTESDPGNLTAYEYSLDNSVWQTMTASSTDPAHSGISSLSASPTGVAHTFVWDAKSQLGSTYNPTVYVRLRPNDGIGNGAMATSTSFAVDYATSTISNVSAVQNLGTSTVTITYDLFDNTTDNILVEPQISGDGGATWMIATSSLSGAVGAGVSAGTSKVITWNALVDYPNQQKNNIQIRLRAKDKFQNQGTYTASANFSLDTLAPTTLTSSNLLSQPNAGDTTALIGGSFTETNPNTNDFYVAINGGAYSTSTAGDINTAAPSNKNTNIGTTLTGHDFISKVKIIHTDDYGLSFANENTTPNVIYKYVKPYTPANLTLDNPVTNRLDLLINPHAGEASDVEYAIYENTQNKYVQSDGTLGTNPVWQTRGTGLGQWGNGLTFTGKVRISGLTSPVSLYSFKVKSRNPSDASHATSSESAWSANASIPNTAPVIALNSYAQTTDGTQYTNINYTGTDGQGDINNITVYEYSTDNTTWHTMTEKTGAGSNGTSSLVFLPSDSSYKFVWDSAANLPDVEDSTVYVRLRSNDAQINSNLAVSSALEIDNKLPVVSSVSATQNVGAKTVAITYNLADANNSNVQIEISSDGGATWAVATSTLSGAVGSGVTPGSKSVTWNAGTNFNGQYNTQMKVRVKARDSFGNQGSFVDSNIFSVDTHAPVLSNVTTAQDSGAKTFTFHYDVTEDFGNANVALEISSNSGSTWTVATSSMAGDLGSITPGTNKTVTWNAGTDYSNQEKATMRIRLTATDNFTNSSNLNSGDFDLDSQAPRITNVTAAQTLASTNVIFHYDLVDQNTSNIIVEISADGGSNWNIATSTVTGDLGAGIVSGTNKIITWNAGTDFSGQDLSTMKIRVRGTDIYSNVSSNVFSSNFSLDTLSPTVNVMANLLAQPLAGATTALIGGSFIENHPDTNNFYIAINGGAYGLATPGTTNTASPSNQLTGAGAALDGNDYISQVKIVHTDDYGQSVNNENTSPNSSYKYVKPYTPAVPTVDNPGIGTVDVLINKNISETDGLEYAIYETSKNKYVQSNGTLGNDPVWQTLGTGSGQWGQTSGVVGKINVNGLTTHSYLYGFQVKSRNTSDSTHAAGSESALSSSASSANQSPVININSVSQINTGAKYVTINYTGSDLESENSSLVTYEYSTDNSIWHTMTEKPGVGSEGTSTLSFVYPGISHTFVWDVAANLNNTEDSTVYVRLKANDGTSNGGIATSPAFTVDTKNPGTSSVSASQNSNSNLVTINYNLTDLSNSTVEIQISADGGVTWTVPVSTATGDLGTNIIPSTNKVITWNPGIDYSGQEDNDLQVKIRAIDNFGNIGSFTTSSNFSVDTNSPRFTNISATQNVSTNTVAIIYDLADANNSTVGLEISSDGGLHWNVTSSSVTGAVGSGVTPGNSKMITWNAGVDFPGWEIANMRIRLYATDTHNNATGNVESDNFSLDTKAPVISNVMASQILGSDDVNFTYDLTDNGATQIFIDISANSGSTWTVATSTLVGAVGSGVTSGNKTVTWNAGVNYNDRQNDTMKVRVRGVDAYNNVSSNIELPGLFLVDTKAPAVNTITNLQAQPQAGDTNVLVGGSFIEANPNTNEFLVAINGGSYLATTTGQADTANPINLSVPTGATLNGNDYISKAEIVHTDDYNHLVVNENTALNIAYKYVKPYTPDAPTINNPQNTSVDLTINAHTGEASEVEYALYEVSSGKYVQANGSLGSSAVWKTKGTAVGQWGNLSGIAGKITVTGLNSPVANYSFMVKSRNTRDTAHATSSESAYSAVSSVINTAPSISITSAGQSLSGSYVVISYTGTDNQNDTNSLTAYEYSTDGLSWHAMTEKTGVGSNGVNNLIFHDTGIAYSFAWDVSHDLPNQEQATVYVRLLSTDTLLSSSLAISSAFYTDTRGPVISGLSVYQTPNSNIVTYEYDLNDLAVSGNNVTLEISDDNGATYNVATTTLVGDLNNVSSGNNRTVTWDAGFDFSGQESSSMKIRLRGVDRYGNLGSYAVSDNFTVDARVPVISSVSASQITGSGNVSINYNLTDNTPAGHLVEFLASSDNGLTWAVATSTVSGEIGVGQTTGAKNFTWSAPIDFAGHDIATMKVKVRAKDYFGNQGAYTSSAAFTLDTLAPTISNISAVQATSTTSININYDLDETATTSLEISADGGATWNVAKTTLAGDLGGVTAGTNKLVTWNAGVDLGNQENVTTRVRLRGFDQFGNTSIYYESSNFAVDTAAPVGLISLNKFSSTSTAVTLTWQANTDAHFNHYELWHGTSSVDVNSHSGSAHKWSTTNDSNLDNPLTISTVITGVDLTTDYFVKIWAIDDFGNTITVPAINIYETPTTPVTPVIPPATQVVSGGAPVISDTFAPAQPIINPLITPTRDTLITISGLAEPRSKVELYDNNSLVGTLDSLTDSNGLFSQNFRFLAGTHSFTVKAIDGAGNISSFSIPVAINIINTIPSTPIILIPQNNSIITNTTPQIIGVADPNNQIIISVDKNEFTVTSDSSGAWNFILPNAFALADGKHIISVIARDQTNVSSEAAISNITKTTILIPVVIPTPTPITAPVIVPGVTPTPVTTPSPSTPPTIVSIPSTVLISETTGATELPGIPVPKVLASESSISTEGDILSFTGTSLPNFDIIAYIHSDQALVYRTRTDAQGNWRINHSQATSELTPGNHTIYAVAFDPDAKVKSRPSDVNSFKVERNIWVMIFNYLNWKTTSVTLVVLVMVMFWLYRVNKKRKTQKK